MQEYLINKGVRRNVILILFVISFLIATFFQNQGIGNTIITFISMCLDKLKIKDMVERLGFLPDILSFTFWYLVIWGLFDKIVWKCPIIQKFHSVPNINGVWEGELTSCYDEPLKHSMKLTVIQTWSQIHFTAKFEKSSSESNIVSIQTDENGHPVIYFCFQNQSQDVSQHQQVYYGFNRIDLNDNVMDGRYSNDRPSNKQDRTDGNCGTFTLTKSSDENNYFKKYLK